ncbi:centriolin isoform X2 [Rhinoderma darwinii]|uniref:centriolin isoform X2 n=1 Tax=Rhinoderma darwinii TaxID=43563 RepID=UPI003F67974E
MKKNSRKSPQSSNKNMRSPTTMKPLRGISSHNLQTTGDSDTSEYEIQEGGDPGVRYITESLVQKLSKQENLAFVKCLNLSLSKDGGKKFKFIENLEKCERLEVLNLGYNLIERVEKLERQTRLRELNLSHNRISKIEGLEHMAALQKLNLSANDIEHIPAWMGKKMKALSALNLKQNAVSSLQDVSRLKPLKDLTSLMLADNPVAKLPHYRLHLVFHLRSLNALDGQTITNQERQEAHDRFNLEEVEKLERDLEKKVKEIEELQSQKTKVLGELQNQDQLNRTLRQETQHHKKSYKELEREMGTKNEILKQKTLELTRACQKQYELEQELAFYKIDAKFEPLGYPTSEEVGAEGGPGESPYIGKARYKRNLYVQESYIPDPAQQIQVGEIAPDTDDQITNQQIRARIHTSLDVDLNEKEKNIRAAETKLTELRKDVVQAEEQIIKASEELKELEDAVTQKKISEAEKEELRQQLSSRIRLLNQLRDEAQELEGQMDWQRREMDKKQREIEALQRHLHSLSPQDPRHSHVKAQKVSKERQLEMMDRQYKQLEGRLDEMLSRIARETEEIKDLEQQLTDGQIAANEALKKDLEGIISGLQEYLESVKGQARQAHDDCRELQSEREVLLQRLEELEEERDRLEAAVQETDHMRKEMEELERSLQEQQEVNESLRRAQGDLSAYEAELEEQVRAREAEITQLKQEQEQRTKQQHAETSAWKAELQRDCRALENALTKAHVLQEQDQDNKKRLLQVHQLQKDNDSLKTQMENLQAQLNDAADNLVRPEQITSRVSELKRKLQTGVGDVRCSGPSDVLGQNLAELQKQIHQILEKSEEEKREAQERQRRLQEEVAALQDRAREAPEDYKRACNKAADARIQLEKRQNEAKVRQLEKQVRQLNEKMKTMEEIQGLADQQLVEAEEERERLLAELQDLETEKTEDSQAQKELSGLDRQLKELKRAIAMSDNMATTELTSAKDQLRSLHGTVRQINRERAEEMQEAEDYYSQAARAARDLAKAEAEIELLQELLHDKEKQLQDELQNSETGLTVSNSQQQEIDKLNHALRKQRLEMERLRHLLEHARADNAGEIENLLDEIQSLRRALGCQSDHITSMADPFRRKGYWYYLPSSCNNSGRDSLSTKDSGVSLHYPTTSSPARRRRCPHRHGKKDAPAPMAAGHWVYSPVRPVGARCDGSRDDEGDSDACSDAPPTCHFAPPPGSVIYTVFPDGTPVPQGTVIYGPPPTSGIRPMAPGTVIYGPPPLGTQVVYGPPPPQFTIPVIPAGVLHCNVPAHHDLENELNRLEDMMDHLKSQRQKEKRLKRTLKEEIIVLENQREALQGEVQELRDATKKRKRKNCVDGHLESLITELGLERSLQHQDNVEDETDCIEETLLKRRAELREADRLLAEAESQLKDARDKTMDLIDKYNAAKKHLSQAESDAEELERRAQETAVNLVNADQHLRILQVNARDLEQHRASQENILQGINSVMAAKDAEYRSLNHKMEATSESLQKLQEEIRVAEGKEEEHCRTLRDAETLLVEKGSALEGAHCQISAQQEALAAMDRHLGQKTRELHLLQSHIDQKKVDLKDVLRDGELDVAEKRQEIKEVKSLLEDLSVQKGELSAQLNEKRSQLSTLTQEILEEEENLQKSVSQIHKQKSELKHVLEMQQLENNELEGLKLQHDQKMNDLEKTQSLLLQGKLELENLQRTSQRVRGEVERQRQLLEKDHREIELLMTQMNALQEKVDALSNEKENLEENNQELERKLTQNKNALLDTEERKKMASGALERLAADISSLQIERTQLNEQKQTVRQETAAAQQIQKDKTEELNFLKDELTDLKDQLRVVEQDLRSATKHRDDMLQETSALQEDIGDAAGRHKLLQEKETRTEERVRRLQRSAEEKERHVSQQDMHLKQMTKEIERQEEHLREAAEKLEIDRQNYERELSDRQNALDVMTRAVRAQEERALKLQQEEMWCRALEESLDTARRLLSEREEQLQDKASEVAALQEALETCRDDLQRLQDEVTSASRRDEQRIVTLKETISKQRTQHEEAAEELKRENSSLKKQLMTVERAAHDNHERVKCLLKELKQLQVEQHVLQQQLRSQEELDKRQQEVNEAVKELKAQVKLEIQSSLQELHCTEGDDLMEDVEPALEQNHSLRAQLHSLRENFPFSANPAPEENRGASRSQLLDEQWRGEALRENLRQQEDRLKAQLHQRMSKQADVLSRGRRQTEGSLHSLRRQLDALDDLVSNVSAVSPFHSQNSSGLLHSPNREMRSLVLTQGYNRRSRISPGPDPPELSALHPTAASPSRT